MKLLVREKVREIITLAMLKETKERSAIVNYSKGILAVQIEENWKVVESLLVDLNSSTAEEELEEVIFKIKSLGGK